MFPKKHDLRPYSQSFSSNGSSSYTYTKEEALRKNAFGGVPL